MQWFVVFFFTFFALCHGIGNNKDARFSQYQMQSLSAHNKYRKLHGVPPLVLNSGLCHVAQEWATHLFNTNTYKHRTDSEYGENLYLKWNSHQVRDDPEEPVVNWYNESALYDYTKGAAQSGTGHFTQLVWKNSKEMGVGIAMSKNKIIVVANYNPPGNLRGEYAINVFRPTR